MKIKIDTKGWRGKGELVIETDRLATMQIDGRFIILNGKSYEFNNTPEAKIIWDKLMGVEDVDAKNVTLNPNKLD
ncbi:MAG: hypothetical protein PF447_05000 [Spirochaetaceae bacterium]|jgi:hypothetical protein|nr:hypothetical protein [Spirochaetaceae bacterium]